MVVLHLQLVPLRKAVVYEVEASETIGNIKAKIEKEEKIPSVLQELTYGTCDLEDQCTVQDYNMHEVTDEIWIYVNALSDFPKKYGPKKRRKGEAHANCHGEGQVSTNNVYITGE